jgi:MFS family permease
MDCSADGLYRVKLEAAVIEGLLMRLWRNQAFAVFWSARTISFAGTGITTVVLPVLVYGMTHSPAWVASLGLIEAVPYLGLGLLAGAVADRMNRKKIMVGCDAIAALLLAAVPAAALHLLGAAQVLQARVNTAEGCSPGPGFR